MPEVGLNDNATIEESFSGYSFVGGGLAGGVSKINSSSVWILSTSNPRPSGTRGIWTENGVWKSDALWYL